MKINLHIWRFEIVLHMRRKRYSSPSVVAVPPELYKVVSDILREVL